MYLVSSNVKANTKFYNSLGFKAIAEMQLGDENPTWKKPPIVIAVVSCPLLNNMIVVNLHCLDRWLVNQRQRQSRRLATTIGVLRILILSTKRNIIK